MRDPELVVRAQVAASALEGAWYRWRVGHGRTSDPMPAVSSYVGYSLQEPWGQPRVVFGLAAEDAEHLAALLERPDRVEPAFAVTTAPPGARDPQALTGARGVTLPLPRQAQLAAANRPAGGENSAYDEPVYRQAAAAMMEAAAARESAGRPKPDNAAPDNAEPADAQGQLDAGNGTPEWTGALSRAASTARAEAEARIKATMSDPDDQRADSDESDVDAGGVEDRQDAAIDDVPASESDDTRPVDASTDQQSADQELRQIYPTDVLEPLPTLAGQDEADAPVAEEPAGPVAPSQDHVPDADDHEVVAAADADAARRGQVTRSYPIARLSKTKRPGAPAPATPTDGP